MEDSIIKKLLEKKYNINNIYVGYIGQQIERPGTTEDEKLADLFAACYGEVIKRWIFKPVNNQPTAGLFVKTMRGYKRITTDKYYKLSCAKTMGEIVIIKKELRQLIDLEPEIYWALKDKYKSEKVPLKAIEDAERQINNKWNNNYLQENSL